MSAEMQTSELSSQQHLYKQQLVMQQQQQMASLHQEASEQGNKSQEDQSGDENILPRQSSVPASTGKESHSSPLQDEIVPKVTPSASNSSYTGAGAGIARMHQLIDAFGRNPESANITYWQAMGKEFFLPDAIMRLVLRNPLTGERKAFDIPSPIIPRFLHTNYISGVENVSLHLERTREHNGGHGYPPPPRDLNLNLSIPSANVTHFVESQRATFLLRYESGWQVHMEGILRAAFVPRYTAFTLLGTQSCLVLESLDFVVNHQKTFIDQDMLRTEVHREMIPQDVVRSILMSKGVAISDEADSKHEVPRASTEQNDSTNSASSGTKPTGFNMQVKKTVVPECPLNEYGITLRAMRCLEITESVCQLRDLMDFTMKEGEEKGPLDGLQRLIALYRAGQIEVTADQSLFLQSQPDTHLPHVEANNKTYSETPVFPHTQTGTKRKTQGDASPSSTPHGHSASQLDASPSSNTASSSPKKKAR